MVKIFKRLLPHNLRRNLGLLKNDSEATLYRLPVVGKTLWQGRIDELEKLPRQLNIEITSICNAKCIMCPRHMMDRKMEVMPRELYEKIISEAKKFGITKFALNGYGEIFTAKKDYAWFIDHLLEQIPEAKIVINTNASLMDEKAAQFLIDRKIDTVHVDIDGFTEETYEKIRLNLNYNRVVKNVKRLLEMRKEQGAWLPKVRVGIISQAENAHEVHDFLNYWRGVADFVADHFIVNRGGTIEIQHEKDVNRPCYLPWSEMNVLSDGSVVLCCDDWNAEAVMGNIKESDLMAIWQGEPFTKVRAKHAAIRAGEVDFCAKCSFARPGPTWFQARHKKAA